MKKKLKKSIRKTTVAPIKKSAHNPAYTVIFGVVAVFVLSTVLYALQVRAENIKYPETSQVNVCSVGQVRCFGPGQQTCMKVGRSNKWSPIISCETKGNGFTCVQGKGCVKK